MKCLRQALAYSSHLIYVGYYNQYKKEEKNVELTDMGSNSGCLFIKVDSSRKLIRKLMSFVKIILLVWEGIANTSL